MKNRKKKSILSISTVAAILLVSLPLGVRADEQLDTISVLSAHLLGNGSADLSCDQDGNDVLNGIDLALARQNALVAPTTTAPTETTVPTTETTTIAQTTAPPDTTVRLVRVSNTTQLLAALADAQAGDEIVLAEGIYLADESSGPKGSLFYSGAEGTAEQPILLRSEDPTHPATLCGTDESTNYVLYLTGDWWQVQDLAISTAQKGIVLDNSNYSRISGCEVYAIGSEGIHLRDDSSNCIVENCDVHDTGTVSPQYGEAIYVGSAKSTTGYGYACDNNQILGCQLGPNVAAEHVDIKEYTTGTIVAECIFDGTGMSGQNAADSFVDIKGNDCIIRDNVGYRNGCEAITAAIQMHVQVEGWGQNAQIYGNQMYMDVSTAANGKPMYLVDGWSSTATVWENQIAYEDGVLFEATQQQYHMKDYTLVSG